MCLSFTLAFWFVSILWFTVSCPRLTVITTASCSSMLAFMVGRLSQQLGERFASETFININKPRTFQPNVKRKSLYNVQGMKKDTKNHCVGEKLEQYALRVKC